MITHDSPSRIWHSSLYFWLSASCRFKFDKNWSKLFHSLTTFALCLTVTWTLIRSLVLAHWMIYYSYHRISSLYSPVFLLCYFAECHIMLILWQRSCTAKHRGNGSTVITSQDILWSRTGITYNRRDFSIRIMWILNWEEHRTWPSMRQVRAEKLFNVIRI